MHVLRIGNPAAPVGEFVSELLVVQPLDGRSQVGDIESALRELGETVEQDGRDDRRGAHALEPAEAAVAVAAGEDLLEQRLGRGSGQFGGGIPLFQPCGEQARVVRLAQ